MSTQKFNMVNLITKKRNGGKFCFNEIEWIINNYVKEVIPDYQMSSLLMAIYYMGMDREEVKNLTRIMINSGEQIDLSAVSGIKVDKHSTGGVGDKISLILAPLVAAAGVPVPMMSGRGLGHTGGTLDKLEAIPGLRTDLSIEEFRNELGEIGFAMMGQTKKIVPADRKLYALRDVTGTVASIPLICSSIISKKKAEGCDGLILDVKSGRGAFMQDRKMAEQLAEGLVQLGNDLGIKTAAVITNMDEPLGYTIGNWLETKESIEALRGDGPEDVMQIVITLASFMLILGRKADTMDQGREKILKLIDSGAGYKKFLQMVRKQGGDVSVVEDMEGFPLSKHEITVVSPVTGFISSIEALKAGLLSVELGAGRKKKEDAVDPGAGILFFKKRGDRVTKGEPLASFYTNKTNLSLFQHNLLECFSFSDSAPSKIELIIGEFNPSIPHQ